MLIKDRKPKGDIRSSGYYRCIGMEGAASLIQKSHSTVIGNGNELEDLIYEYSSHLNKFKKEQAYDTKATTKFDLRVEDAFIVKFKMERKEVNEKGKKKKIDCDAVLVQPDKITLFEIKDGADFDTKKSEGEYRKLHEATGLVEEQDPLKRKCDFKFVSWNVNDVSEISLKYEPAKPHLMTGRDFAQLTGVDYKKLNAKREEDRKANGEYVIEEMKNILHARGWVVLPHVEELVNETIL